MKNVPALDDQITGPYPGLRPFEKYEAPIFFGRGIQVDDMIRRLEDHRFLAVVGSSGCGKSSLVRAGLLPALEEGELFTAGSDWLTVIAKPGATPFRNLATSWIQSQGSNSTSQSSAAGRKRKVAMTEAVLQSGPHGFLELLNDAGVPPEQNVLLLIDQFEEIFRFRYDESPDDAEESGMASDDANAFVNLLLATAKQTGRNIYVMLTMRSDFLGDCNAFHGLPEAINDSQFLAPRMNQKQIRQAIVGPLRLFGGVAEPALVNRIIGDVGNDPDQLPLMQHVLMRMWNRQHKKSETGSDGDRYSLTVKEYESLGGVRDALSNHATEIFEELKEQGDERIVEMLFRGLRQRGDKGQEIRRPESIKNIAASIERDVDDALINDVIKVADAFRRPDCSFLMPPQGVELAPDTLVDISHESLIRRWKKMRQWAEHEDESAEILDFLVRSAKAYGSQSGDLLERKNLERVSEWRARSKPTPGWARRYETEEEVNRALVYLNDSRTADDQRRTREREQEEEEQQRAIQELETAKKLAEGEKTRAEFNALKSRNLRIGLLGLAFLFVVAVALLFWANRARNAAVAAETVAANALIKTQNEAELLAGEKEIAEEKQRDAEDAKADAQKKAEASELAKGIAVKKQEAAQFATKTALDEKNKLKLENQKAVKKQEEAEAAQKAAVKEADRLREAKGLADEEKNKASEAHSRAIEAMLVVLPKADTGSVEFLLEEQKKLVNSENKLVDQISKALAKGEFRDRSITEQEKARYRLALLVVANQTEQIRFLLDFILESDFEKDELVLFTNYLVKFKSELENHGLWEKLDENLSSLDRIRSKTAAAEKIFEENNSTQSNPKVLLDAKRDLEALGPKLENTKEKIFRIAVLLANTEPGSSKWQSKAERLVTLLTEQNLDAASAWGQMLQPVGDQLQESLKRIYTPDLASRQRENTETLLKAFGQAGVIVESTPDITQMVEGMALINPGKFKMGPPGAQHEVTITEGFYIGKTEVTQKQYELVIGKSHNPSIFKGNERPVENVSWQDAMDFCQILNKLEEYPDGLGLEKLPRGYEYRLPTEAQWEYACRGKESNPSVPQPLNQHAVFKQDQTMSVRSKTPNTFGLFDMLGNVEEWCLDYYGPYPEQPMIDPTGPIYGKEHVFRGGSYFTDMENISPTKRDKGNYWGQTNGFRIVGVKLPAAKLKR